MARMAVSTSRFIIRLDFNSFYNNTSCHHLEYDYEISAYNEYGYYQISQKRKNAQLKNIRKRMAKLNLSEMELKALIQIIQ